ncbi:TPA: transcriptional regulator [Salmonella enterica subsp. enterica serovar Concord]|nr:transcriptional regulator [Salmonella enterica subsp. enterica serovar Concord]
MPSTVAEEVLSDPGKITNKAWGNDESPNIIDLVNLLSALDMRATQEGKKSKLRLDGPIAAVAFLDKAAAYIGLTREALAAALRRGEMPGHKKRKNPEDESSGGDWIFNVKAWNELADELPELEPPEWHHWKDYWTYNRGNRKFQQVKKEDCVVMDGRRVYKPRKSRLEQANNL